MLAILHGSQATGHANDNSDWDVAIMGAHVLNRDERAKLKRSLGERLGVPEEKIDIADLRTDAPLLRYQVAIHGKLIEGDPRDLLDFQIRAWKDYLNNEKFLDLQTAFLKKALT